MKRAAVLAFCVAIAAASAVDTPAALAQAPTANDREALDAAHALLAPAEWAAIRGVIAEQLAALRGGDGERAFSFASPGIRERFGDAAAFLAMVRDSYAPLLGARYTEYLDGAVVDGSPIQPVRLVMHDDTVLVALYQMTKGDDGRWRVAGCVLAPSTVRSV